MESNVGHSQTSIQTSCSASSAHRAPYDKLVCVMVGLPARGKSYISRKLSRYLNWLGISTRVFNVGQYRRRLCGADLNAEFFDTQNEAAQEMRARSALAALDDMLAWLGGDAGSCAADSSAVEDAAQVAIYDATNTTCERRAMVHARCTAAGVGVLFIESVCDLPDVVHANIKDVKLSSPDYAHVSSSQDVVADFLARIAHYAAVYETLDGGADAVPPAGDAVVPTSAAVSAAAAAERGYSYIKLMNIGERVVLNRIRDYRQSQIVYFLLNLHIRPRSVYVARHGETVLNSEGRIGGDGALSPAGERFAALLPALMRRIHGAGELAVWTSAMRRTVATAAHLPYARRMHWRALNEIDAGVCEGLTYDEIARDYPADFAARDCDKFRYRYRGGESYADVVKRLEPIILEAERAENVLIVGHQAVLRAVLAYFFDKPPAELPYIRVPLHTVLQLTPRAYGCEATAYVVEGLEAVDTHRPCPGQPELGDLGPDVRIVRIAASDLERDLP